MELQIFNVLEEKINRVVRLVENLKTENHELRMRIQELQALLEERERTLYALRVEIEKSKTVQNEIETYKKNQDQIRIKVENLLQKLKAFEDIP